MPITFAVPKSLVMRTQACDYCGAPSVRDVMTDHRLHGIRCCAEHHSIAKRDVRAWFREQNIVRQKEFLAIHPKLWDMKLNIPRTDGTITSGGNLSAEEFQFFQKGPEGWRVTVLFTDPVHREIMMKGMRLTHLDKSGISEEEIAAWTQTLDEFYATEYAEHLTARASGEQAPDRESPMVSTIYANGVECRVFIP
jgi:hypothetical protein